ncbi:uncharacterized protein LOC114254345 [Monomorium pharaonis]|uniref:uncharacterized protein LOC114254345 n=1 Tax=Monomorium pharaonis TaxID=307658 RepID=UPI001746ED10|nr:uncharacterized protein LOC114254345 [Monomorium pharaonis]
MDSERENDKKTSHFVGVLGMIPPNPGNILDIKNSIRKDIENPKEIIVEAKNRTKQDKSIPHSGNNFSRLILDTETEYDEYEEDENLVQWQLPKMRKLPTLSSILREWSMTQVSVVAHILHKNSIKVKNNYIVQFSLIF